MGSYLVDLSKYWLFLADFILLDLQNYLLKLKFLYYQHHFTNFCSLLFLDFNKKNLHDFLVLVVYKILNFLFLAAALLFFGAGNSNNERLRRAHTKMKEHQQDT